MSTIDLLRQSSLFDELPEQDLLELARVVGRRTFAANIILFHKGSPGQRLYLIQEGKVRIFSLSDAGRELTLNVLGPGECFGEMALLDDQPRSAGAITLERTVLYTLERQDFLRLLRASPDLCLRIMALLTARIRRATAHAESLAFLDVPDRVAATLLDLAERYGADRPEGVEIRVRLTQAELASYVAASRESVNKVLGTLRDQGLIRLEGQAILILDLAGLKRRMNY